MFGLAAMLALAAPPAKASVVSPPKGLKIDSAPLVAPAAVFAETSAYGFQEIAAPPNVNVNSVYNVAVENGTIDAIESPHGITAATVNVLDTANVHLTITSSPPGQIIIGTSAAALNNGEFERTVCAQSASPPAIASAVVSANYNECAVIAYAIDVALVPTGQGGVAAFALAAPPVSTAVLFPQNTAIIT